MSKDSLLSIVIVNWNTGKQLAEVVLSINEFHKCLVSSVIIVDNASSDDSLIQVEILSNLEFKVVIIRNSENLGFGAACNQGAKMSDSEYLLFLNPDMKLFQNSLSVPLAFIQEPKNQDVGVVGIQLVDERNLVARSCARFPSLGIFAAPIFGLNRLPGKGHLSIHMADWAHNETRAVDHVIGAFYLMRRALFNALEGFDERFFVYLEDLDLSLRIRQGGFRIIYLTEAHAFHVGGGTSRQIKPLRLFYSLRSRLLYGFKHFNTFHAWILVLITLGIEPVTRSVFALAGDGLAGVRNTWQAYGMLLRDLGSILKVKR